MAHIRIGHEANIWLFFIETGADLDSKNFFKAESERKH